MSSEGLVPVAGLRLGLSWITVAAMWFGDPTRSIATHPLVAGAIFTWLMGTIVWAAFGVVHEAEEVAERLGEPLGTLVLTLSIVVIEVALIGAVMLGAKHVPTLGRDTMFAVLMIVLNGVVGLCLLVGGLRFHRQSYNLQGAGAYLAVIIPLSVVALVLPNFTTSSALGMLTLVQAVAFSAFTIGLYGIFLWLQTGRHRGFFVAVASQTEDDVGRPVPHHVRAPGTTARRVAMLIVNILPIVLLSKDLAKLLDHGIAVLGAPSALGGIVIALIVFTPEGISALKAVAANQLTRAINLCLGAAASTLGLTVPAVLFMGLATDQSVIMGISPANMVLLAVTLMLNTLTFSGTRTTMLEGAVHMSLFFVFVVLVFSP